MSRSVRQGVAGAQGDIKTRHVGVRACGKGLRAVIWCRRYLPARSFTRRSEKILRLCRLEGAHMRYVGGAAALALNGGSCDSANCGCCSTRCGGS